MSKASGIILEVVTVAFMLWCCFDLRKQLDTEIREHKADQVHCEQVTTKQLEQLHQIDQNCRAGLEQLAKEQREFQILHDHPCPEVPAR